MYLFDPARCFGYTFTHSLLVNAHPFHDPLQVVLVMCECNGTVSLLSKLNVNPSVCRGVIISIVRCRCCCYGFAQGINLNLKFTIRIMMRIHFCQSRRLLRQTETICAIANIQHSANTTILLPRYLFNINQRLLYSSDPTCGLVTRITFIAVRKSTPI